MQIHTQVTSDMSFLDTQEMYAQLSADIEGATSIRDLYSLMELILPLSMIKKVLKERGRPYIR